MNNHESKKRWKIILLIFASVIGLSSLIYTNFLVKRLQKQEKEKVQLYMEAQRQIVKTNDSDYMTFLLDRIIAPNNSPMIIADSNEVIKTTRGLDPKKTMFPDETDKEYDSLYFREQLEEMKAEHDPIQFELYDGEKQYIYYQDSFLLTQLRIYPYVQLTVIAIFLLASYLAFSSSRRAEQNQVWVGMAKETAHQLGTPISSLLAWMEHLRAKSNEEEQQFLDEMENDIRRLELVTERFSKIGSLPVLLDEPVLEVVNRSIDYIRRRSSAKILFEVKGDPSITAKLNTSLFDWVIENLCKNAVNAIGSAGKISIFIHKHKELVYIDVSDTGSGIPKSKFEVVFEPGYTTRKRGWGLGLSLVKRIVESYHSGRIFVKESTVGKGTTFRIILHA